MTEAEKDAWIVLLRSDVAKYREVFDALYSVYSSLNSANFADGLREKHKKVLAGNSKAMFAEAVKLDKELKELNDEE